MNYYESIHKTRNDRFVYILFKVKRQQQYKPFTPMIIEYCTKKMGSFYIDSIKGGEPDQSS